MESAAVPANSTVLVTGVNGFIGSHVANEFLQRGYRVRGTVRNVEKSAWVQNLFDNTYGQDKFSLIPLVDLTNGSSFVSLVRGTSAVVHVASPIDWDDNLDTMIPRAVSGALNALKAAMDEPSVKRFVLTSSSLAAADPKPNKEGIVVTTDTWNEEALDLASRKPPFPPESAWLMYAASKAQVEKEVWKYYYDNKSRRPDFVVNAVLPATNYGKSLDPLNQGYPSTSSFIESLWNGTQLETLKSIPPQYFIDVQDVARLHFAATVLPEVQEERIFAWAEPWNFDLILAILRRQNIGRNFIGDFQSDRELSDVSAPKQRAREILMQIGVHGFTGLEDSVKSNTEGLFYDL